MRAKCGACGNAVEIPGAGRFECPICGQLNEVRPASAPPEALRSEQVSDLPPPEQPSERLTCPSCSFSFIVGDVESAICPNCRSEVSTGASGTGTTDE